MSQLLFHKPLALRKLLSEIVGESTLGVKLGAALPTHEQLALLELLKEEAERHPDRKTAASALHKLGIQKTPGAAAKLIEVARSVSTESLLPFIPQNIAA